MRNKQNSIIKSITFIFSFLFLVFFILFYAWWGIFLPKDSLSKEEKIFLIEKGQGTREIAFNLEKQGFIKFAPLFRIYTLFKGISGKLQAGAYRISPSMNVPQILEKFVKGETAKEKITIIEGWNKKEIADYLEGRGIVSSEKFLKALNLNWQEKYEFLKDKPPNLDLEGYLFPDTYFIDYDTILTIVENVLLEREEKIVEKMLDNFDKKLTLDLREEIKRQKKSIFEIVTMASLIEKEVRTFEDKKLVSGILWKRLKNDMPLQVDATIVYIIGKKTTDPEGPRPQLGGGADGARISIEETKIDSPYNTYKYKGLPLGPISNPGLESIMAVLYPEDSAFWYYLSTPEGQTTFSKTFEEHKVAKEKYLR